MLIGLNGFTGAGKDLTSRILAEHGFAKYAFADAIRDRCLADNPVLFGGVSLVDLIDGLGWDGAKRDPMFDNDIRVLLQDTGQELLAEHGPYFLIRTLERQIITDGLRSNQFRDVVITDVRMPAEAQWVKQMGGATWRINRDGTGPVNGHVTEQALPPELIDVVIDNSGSVKKLRRTIALLIGQERTGGGRRVSASNAA